MLALTVAAGASKGYVSPHSGRDTNILVTVERIDPATGVWSAVESIWRRHLEMVPVSQFLRIVAKRAIFC